MVSNFSWWLVGLSVHHSGSDWNISAAIERNPQEFLHALTTFWSMTFSVAPPIGQNFHLFWEISQHLINWLAKFCTGIHGPRKMKPTDYGYHLDFSLVPPAVGHLWFCVKFLNNYCIRWVAMSLGADFHVLLTMNCNNFVDPLMFCLTSSIIWSKFKCAQYFGL